MNGYWQIAFGLVLFPQLEGTELLPQAAYRVLGALSDEVTHPGPTFGSFVHRTEYIGDLDLTAYMLSRNGFRARMTAEQACSELVAPVCGEEVSSRVFKALELIGQSMLRISEHHPDLATLAPNVVLKHYESDELPPAWWGEVRAGYLNAMNEMYRANSRAREGGRSFTLYLARRYEFGFEYMNCIEAVRRAGIAKRKKDGAGHAAELQKAVDSMHGALNALAAVARSQSDRGTIAVLNEYGYRPLVKELESLEEP